MPTAAATACKSDCREWEHSVIAWAIGAWLLALLLAWAVVAVGSGDPKSPREDT